MSDEDDLAARVADLESTVRDLQREVGRPPRGPFGLPRPPTPRELLAFTDDHAIPATVAFLEAHVRALEALRAAIRVVRRADDTHGRGADAADRTRELGTAAVSALDDALADVRDAYREGRLPDNPDARRLLEDADRLTDEIAGELDAAREDRPTRPSVDPDAVETELDVLRKQYGDDADADSGDGPDDDAA